jgi:hypothetical protein
MMKRSPRSKMSVDLLSLQFGKQRQHVLGGHASIAHRHTPEGMMMVPEGEVRGVCDGGHLGKS